MNYATFYCPHAIGHNNKKKEREKRKRRRPGETHSSDAQ